MGDLRNLLERTSSFLSQTDVQNAIFRNLLLETVQPSSMKTDDLKAFYGLELRDKYRQGEFCRGNIF